MVPHSHACQARRLTLTTATAPERPRRYDDSVFGQRFAPDAPKAARPVSGAARDTSRAGVVGQSSSIVLPSWRTIVRA